MHLKMLQWIQIVDNFFFWWSSCKWSILFLIDYGILVSSVACIPMRCIQIPFGHLQAPPHLVTFIVVEETFRWVLFYNSTNSCFPWVIGISLFEHPLPFTFVLIFCMPNSVHASSYTWQTWQRERVYCYAQRNILFRSWHCMMMVYGLQQQILL